MLKSFLDGLAKKAGETLGVWLWPALFAVLAALGLWLSRPDQLQVSRGALLAVGILAVAFVVLAYIVGFLVAKRRYVIKTPPLDELQRQVLCLLWAQQENEIDVERLLKLTKAHPSELTLAGGRLRQRGLIVFDPIEPEPTMRLRHAGREYIKAERLDKVVPTPLAERLRRLDD